MYCTVYDNTFYSFKHLLLLTLYIISLQPMQTILHSKLNVRFRVKIYNIELLYLWFPKSRSTIKKEPFCKNEHASLPSPFCAELAPLFLSAAAQLTVALEYVLFYTHYVKICCSLQTNKCFALCK